MLPFSPELSSSLPSKNKKIKIHISVILSVVFYGCETWPFILREERKLKVFEKRMLRKMFGYERERVTGEWKKLHKKKLYDLYSTPNIRVMKSRKSIQAWHVARMRERRDAYRVLVGKPKGKGLGGRTKHR